MEKVILIKYGELTTKKGNRNFFVKTLTNNIEKKLSAFDVTIEHSLSLMTIKYALRDEEDVLKVINTIFGIHSYH